MKTIGDALKEHHGIGPGFDQIRAALAVSILFWHSFGLTYGEAWVRSIPAPFPQLVAMALPMFFALSGFLVTGSALRTNHLKIFLTFRALRILPALIVEVSLSALVLGTMLTTLRLSDYFTSGEFIEYFGSIIGRVRFALPGLFETNKVPLIVNGALWTLGAEVICYVAIALLMLFGYLQRRKVVLAFVIAYIAMCIGVDAIHQDPVREILPTKSLVLCFLIGNLIFLYRDRIPLNFGCAVFAFLVSLPIIALAQYNPRFKVAVYPAVAGISYVVVFLGLKKLPTLPLFRNGDYSYGIYIYGWPIQQSVLYLFPDHRNWWFNFMISLPLTFAFAAASWHFVERPFLSLRKNFSYGSTEPKIYRRLAFAAALLLYGLFVSYVDDVFPLRHIFGKTAQAATPIF